MVKLLNVLHGCAAKDAEEAEADVEADSLPQGKRGVDRRIGEVKRRPDQHGVDGDDGQV